MRRVPQGTSEYQAVWIAESSCDEVSKGYTLCDLVCDTHISTLVFCILVLFFCLFFFAQEAEEEGSESSSEIGEGIPPPTALSEEGEGEEEEEGMSVAGTDVDTDTVRKPITIFVTVYTKVES